MLLLDHVKVIIYLVRVQGRGDTIKMQGQLCQVVGIIAQGALTSASHCDFLTELLVKFPESCYIGAGCLDKVCFPCLPEGRFFMIERNN